MSWGASGTALHRKGRGLSHSALRWPHCVSSVRFGDHNSFGDHNIKKTLRGPKEVYKNGEGSRGEAI